MATQPFQFKHFEVAYQRSSMAVGTDAVLLGAWASHPAPTRLLDIGTGSGVIALMIAQRFAQAQVDAVELVEPSAEEAAGNFNASPFAKRVQVFKADVTQWQPDRQYDLIVSNPPYFAGGITPAEEARKVARHEVALSHTQLLKTVDRLLIGDGVFACVLPFSIIKQFIKYAELSKLTVNAIVYIKYNPVAAISVCLLQFSRQDVPLQLATLILNDADGKPTPEYIQLISPFYLWA